MMSPRNEEAEVQRRYFEDADVAHFDWTTQAEGVAEIEDDLLAPLLGSIDGPCLEIGCGEGNNLVRLAPHGRWFGLDLFVRKLHFAARQLPEVAFVNADADGLPFADASFQTVLVRDLLHHVPEPERTLREAVRVLRPGGQLLILEPNGRNPLVLLQTILVRAEVAARRFRAERIRAWLEPLALDEVRLEMRQALPLRRMFLHYRFGWPALGRSALARQAMRALESLLALLLPASAWSYIMATARRVPGA